MVAHFLLPVALAACASAIILPQPYRLAAVTNKPISLPLVRKEVPRGLTRRNDDSATLYNKTNVAYMIELDIGTPAQKVQVQLDTGSDQLWVNPDCSRAPSPNIALCNSLGQFDADKSSTIFVSNLTTQLAYGTGQAEVTFVLDNMTLPGSNLALSQVQFGVATASKDASTGILGVGYGRGYNIEYDNIIDELYLQNQTNSRLFSVALGTATKADGDDVGDNIVNGVIVFGGADTSKFTGPLHSYDILGPQSSDSVTTYRYWVQLNSVGYTKPGSKNSNVYAGSSTPVVLDTGSSITYLPSDTLLALANDMGAKQADVTSNGIRIDCDKGDKGGSVDFTFGNLTINVPINDILWEVEAGQCVLGILPSDDFVTLFGDTFLRSVYTMFDVDNEKIYMAPAANCGTKEAALPAARTYSLTGDCQPESSAAPGSLAPLSLAALVGLVGAQAVAMLL